MDRRADLAYLKADMDNPLIPLAERHRASETYEKIQRQLKDKKLMGMRERLTKAHAAADKHAMWQIGNQIKDYLKEPQIEEGTN